MNHDVVIQFTNETWLDCIHQTKVRNAVEASILNSFFFVSRFRRYSLL